jgi:hypothetical protein
MSSPGNIPDSTDKQGIELRRTAMRSKLGGILVLALGVLIGVAPVVLAASSTSGPPPSATIVAPESPTTTYEVRDMHGEMVTVEVPSLAPPALKVSDPVQGTVRATVMVVDGQTNQVKVQTQEGQMLVLNLTPESVKAMHVGEQFTLRITQPSGQ